MDHDTEPRPRYRPRPRTTAAPESGPTLIDVTGDDNQESADWPDVGASFVVGEFDDTPFQPPWWIVHGEEIDATALSNRKRRRERNRELGLPAGYDTFWGFVDIDPTSVVSTVRTAKMALELRDFALQRLTMPGPLALVVSAVMAAAAAYGFSGGSLTDRLAACATSLVVGIMLAMAVPGVAKPPRLIAIAAAAAAAACVALSALPVIHVTRWYGVLVGLAFSGAGLAAAALWPITRAWRIEKSHWTSPDVALVGAILEFADGVELDLGPEARRRAVAALDRAATRFELAWHRERRTGVDTTDRQLRGWAGRIRAETRELQRWFAFGSPSTLALLMRTYELIQAIVNRYSLEEHEDTWIRHGSWSRPPTSTLGRLWARSKVSGRYARQCLIAGFITIVAAVLLADTIWSAVPAYIGTHVSQELGEALTFDPAVQLFVAGISLSLFGIAARAFARRH